MLEAKLAGQEIKRPEPGRKTPVIDLMEALRQSVSEAQKQKEPASRAKAKSGRSSGTRKRPLPARSSPRFAESLATFSDRMKPVRRFAARGPVAKRHFLHLEPLRRNGQSPFRGDRDRR